MGNVFFFDGSFKYAVKPFTNSGSRIVNVKFMLRLTAGAKLFMITLK